MVSAGGDDRVGGAINLRAHLFAGFFGQLEVLPRVVTHDVPLGDHSLHRLFSSRHLAADEKEGRPGVRLLQDVEKADRARGGAVVEGEGDALLLAAIHGVFTGEIDRCQPGACSGSVLEVR